MNIGDRVGDYEIIEVLGVGGMGEVYKVRNVLSERVEAMKVLLPNLEGDPGLADRFLREIKVQAALDHPNIAKLNTAMRIGNQLVMIMEFVAGTSIAQMLAEGGIPASSAVSYAGQVLDALAYAHKRGVVHRDIKPANIMVTPSGMVKLMDFGIASIKADQKLTKAGGTVGSLLYMSPEQIKGLEPDGRADIYSLGITLYEMVTGRRPFNADSDFQLMSAHLMQAPIAPIEVIPGVPQDLNDIILMAIAKEPDQRFLSAEAFRGALGSLGIPIPRAGGSTTQTMLRPPAPMPSTQVPAQQEYTLPPTLPMAAQTPPPAVPPPIAHKSYSSKRGLYMALGSLATIAVLIAAVIEGPKLIRGGSSGAASSIQPSTQTNSVAPTGSSSDPSQVPSQAGQPQAPASQPVETQPAAQSEPQNSAPAPSAPVPAASTPASQPAQTSPMIARPGQRLTPTNIVAPALAPAARPQQQQAEPVQAQQQQAPIQQAAPQAAPPSAPAAPPRNVAELNELRQRYNEISIRAAAAKDGVNMMEQRMARQGVGLRGDISAARTRLDYLLQEAMQAIRAGDVEGARRNLEYADGNAATLEKFLGR